MARQGLQGTRGGPSSAVLAGPLGHQWRPTHCILGVGRGEGEVLARGTVLYALAQWPMGDCLVCSVLGTWSAAREAPTQQYQGRSQTRWYHQKSVLGKSSCRSGAGPAWERRRGPLAVLQIGSTQFQARPIAGKPSSPRWNHGNLSVTETPRRGRGSPTERGFGGQLFGKGFFFSYSAKHALVEFDRQQRDRGDGDVAYC